MIIFKNTAKLKEFYSKQQNTHHRDYTTNILLYFVLSQLYAHTHPYNYSDKKEYILYDTNYINFKNAG